MGRHALKTAQLQALGPDQVKPCVEQLEQRLPHMVVWIPKASHHEDAALGCAQMGQHLATEHAPWVGTVAFNTFAEMMS